MEILTLVFSCLAIFFPIILKFRIGKNSSEQIALVLYCYVFGGVSNILCSYSVTERVSETLILVSSILFFLSGFFIYSTNKSILLGKLFLMAAPALTFAVTFVEQNFDFVEICRIFSYVSLFFVFVFDPNY